MGYEHRYVFGRVVGYIDHRFVSGKIPYVLADVVIDAGKLTGFPDNLEVFNCAVRCPGMLEPEYEDDTGDFFRRVSLEDIYNWACTHAAKEKVHLYYDIIRDVAKVYMDSECRDDIVVIHWGY